MPSFNLDIDVDLDAALRHVDSDDLIQYVIYQYEAEDILREMDAGEVRTFAIDELGLVEEE